MQATDPHRTTLVNTTYLKPGQDFLGPAKENLAELDLRKPVLEEDLEKPERAGWLGSLREVLRLLLKLL